MKQGYFCLYPLHRVSYVVGMTTVSFLFGCWNANNLHCQI